jgi:hypothetical protein
LFSTFADHYTLEEQNDDGKKLSRDVGTQTPRACFFVPAIGRNSGESPKETANELIRPDTGSFAKETTKNL